MLSLFRKLFGFGTDFRQLMGNGAVVIDVRTPAEFKSGNVPGSKNIPLDALKKEIPQLKKLNKPIITICQSGGRSSMAKSWLNAAGIEVYNGGGWQSFRAKTN